MFILMVSILLLVIHQRHYNALCCECLLGAYGDHAASVWWQANKTKISALKNVSVVFIRDEELKCLETLVERSMQLQLTIESEQAWLSDQHGTSIAILPEWWQR